MLSAPAPVVFDHFAQAEAGLGVDQAGFAALLRLLRSGRAYVKVLSYEVAPDGQRFLLVTPNPEANRAEIHVVLNWFKELEEREKAAGR